MILLGTGALVAAERGKQAELGARGYSFPCRSSRSGGAAEAAIAQRSWPPHRSWLPSRPLRTLAQVKGVDAALTIDAMVIAIAARADAIVLTGDVADFERLTSHVPHVTILSV